MAGSHELLRIDRRRFLRSSALALGGLALPLAGLHRCRLGELGLPEAVGPLEPVLDLTTGLPLLKLPRGFFYQSFGWTGDAMDDGSLTPDRHDGMAVVDVRRGSRGVEIALIRNHERSAILGGQPVPLIGDGAAPVYDEFAIPGLIEGLGGGTTALVFGGPGRFLGAEATLAGTLTNCAGGPTPWGSWLTCEEVTLRGSLLGARDHGYVFEVPAPGNGRASAVPIVDMGFMDHEAVAVDPRTGFVYLTEDNGPRSGFYRFRPHARPRRPGDLEGGGALEMLAVVGEANADLRDVEEGQSFPVEWVEVPEPNADPEAFEPPLPGFPPIGGSGRSGPFLQGEAAGGAVFRRGEGCWYHHGIVYFVDTSGGAAGKGSVFALEVPRDPEAPGRLTALFVSPGEEVADNPDNLTVSPRGGLVLCEDGGGRVVDGERVFGTRLLGVSFAGQPFALAENNVQIDGPIEGRPAIAPADYRDKEFAGATFSPRGRVLFVNIQTPGITFAIQGPWERLGL